MTSHEYKRHVRTILRYLQTGRAVVVWVTHPTLLVQALLKDCTDKKARLHSLAFVGGSLEERGSLLLTYPDIRFEPEVRVGESRTVIDVRESKILPTWNESAKSFMELDRDEHPQVSTLEANPRLKLHSPAYEVRTVSDLTIPRVEAAQRMGLHAYVREYPDYLLWRPGAGVAREGIAFRKHMSDFGLDVDTSDPKHPVVRHNFAVGAGLRVNGVPHAPCAPHYRWDGYRDVHATAPSGYMWVTVLPGVQPIPLRSSSRPQPFEGCVPLSIGSVGIRYVDVEKVSRDGLSADIHQFKYPSSEWKHLVALVLPAGAKVQDVFGSYPVVTQGALPSDRSAGTSSSMFLPLDARLEEHQALIGWYMLAPSNVALVSRKSSRNEPSQVLVPIFDLETRRVYARLGRKVLRCLAGLDSPPVVGLEPVNGKPRLLQRGSVYEVGELVSVRKHAKEGHVVLDPVGLNRAINDPWNPIRGMLDILPGGSFADPSDSRTAYALLSLVARIAQLRDERARLPEPVLLADRPEEWGPWIGWPLPPLLFGADEDCSSASA